MKGQTGQILTKIYSLLTEFQFARIFLFKDFEFDKLNFGLERRDSNLIQVSFLFFSLFNRF